MLTRDAIRYINSEILRQSDSLRYTVSSIAPSTERELFNCPGLVIWNGQSEQTIYQCPAVNWAFRAIHDNCHLKTRLGFSIAEEIEMGRIQAAKQSSDLMSNLFYCEIALQAKYYGETGLFVQDQVNFTEKVLKF